MTGKSSEQIRYFKDTPLSSLWFEPTGACSQALILAHGAGGDKSHPFFLLLGEALSRLGTLVVIFNFPYREMGRQAPDPQRRLEASYRFMIDQVREKTDRLLIGGRSMGGRIASHIATQDAALSGLILLAYPLHPVGKPEKLRVAHLSNILCPTLFVQGTRDPFCKLSLLDPGLENMRAPYKLHLVADGDHSFKTRKSSGRTADEVEKEVLSVVEDFLSRNWA